MSDSKRSLAFHWWALFVAAVLAVISALHFRDLIPVVLIGVFGYAYWHLYQLSRLLERFEGKARFPRTPRPGPWGELYSHLRALKKRSKKRKRRVRTFTHRFQESADALPDAVVIIEKHGDIVWCNAMAYTLLGLDLPGVRGQDIAMFVEDPVFRDYLRGGKYKRPLEFTSPTDQSRMLSVMVKPFGSKSERLLIARDITRQYYVDRAHSDFIANASHELRTPLTVIRGFLESSPQPSDRAVDLMRQQAVRMEHTLEDLLTLSELDTIQQTPQSSVVDIKPLVESIVSDARGLSGACNHSFDIVIQDPRSIRGYEPWLRSAFSNLLINAVKHTPALCHITVRWVRDNGGARFSVEDNGEGIAARHVPRLGERFYRVDQNSEEKRGTGLGLSIVKLVLSSHEADLRISSEVGKGSVFSCVFPSSRLVEPGGAEAAQ